MSGGLIKPIDKASVHRICSGQVIFNLAIAVKELVENSIDAGATLVEIKLKEFGETSIEVSDNGNGVAESNFQGLTAKYHTSKLREFEDLETVSTFGFRGEALSSLCSVSQMTIITKHVTADCATKLEIDNDGVITKKSAVARQTGTSVIIQNLFAKLPVRKIEFRRNIKKEFAKMVTIVQAYGIVSERCRIICSNVNEKGNKSVVLNTTGGTMLENILNVFGNKQQNDLVPIKALNEGTSFSEDALDTTEIREELTQLANTGLDRLNMNMIKLNGFVSSCEHGKGRSSRDRQFFYVNNRPCEPKNVMKLVNDVYRKYNINQYPFVSLNITMDRTDVDVNLTPDKRQVLINNETILLLAIKIALIRTFEGMVGVYRIQNNISLINPKSSQSSVDASLGSDSDEEDNDDKDKAEPETEGKEVDSKWNSLKFSQALRQWKETGDTVMPAGSNSKGVKRKCVQNDISRFSSKMRKIQEALDADKTTNVASNISLSEGDEVSESESNENDPPQNISTIICSNAKPEIIFEDKHSSGSSQPRTPTKKRLSQTTLNTPTQINCIVDSPRPIKIIEEKPENRPPPQNVSKSTMRLKRTKVMLKMSIDTIREAVINEDKLLGDSAFSRSSRGKLKFRSKIEPTANKRAEEELSRAITKSSFGQMEIIGQFNLGFIVVRLDNDLFIIDQHASDEKYNFETLQKTTVLQNQKLVIPQSLELSVPKEILLMDNLPVFKMNGFTFLIDDDAPHTKKVKLLTKPFSQNWEFGKDDIDELLFMLQDAPANTMCRPSRVRAMFASRACRKSVMVGSALSRRDMQRIVRHMGEIEHPWHCPHGRPTMRHLIMLHPSKH